MTRRRSAASGFEQRFLANLRAADISSGDRLVVGFSGGVDSLALAYALSRVRRSIEPDVTLVHVDHGLRRASAQDSKKCATLAEELEFPLCVATLDPGLALRTAGLGLEEAARRERYLSLAQAASSQGSSTILLGHQANDQAETVLLRLLRGTGIDGLSGMTLRDDRDIPWWPSSDSSRGRFAIVRPMLSESRTVIEDYLAHSGLSPLRDESNASTEFDRNWIRHEVLPPMLKRWPGGIGSIGRLADAARDDWDYLERAANHYLETNSSFERTVCTDALSELHPAIGRRIVRHWLRGIGLETVTFDVVARCYELLLRGREDALVQAGKGVSVILANGCLIEMESLLDAVGAELPIERISGGTLWNVSIVPPFGEAQAIIDVPHSGRCEVRRLRFGDCWWNSNRSVFDDLRAAGIHPLVRDRVLAVVCDDGVLLIPAIYPTIYARSVEGDSSKVGVIWQRSA